MSRMRKAAERNPSLLVGLHFESKELVNSGQRISEQIKKIAGDVYYNFYLTSLSHCVCHGGLR